MKLLFALLFLKMLTSEAEGKGVVRVTAVDNLRSPAGGKTLLEEVLKQTNGSLLHQTYDAYLARALDADRRQIEAIFQQPWGELAGIATTVYGHEDILAARWDEASNSGVRSVILWDAPRFNLVVARCDLPATVSAAAIKTFLENFVRLDGSPIDVVSIDTYLLNRPTSEGFFGLGLVNYQRAPKRALTGYEFTISAYRLPSGTYFVFQAGKKLVAGIYPADGGFIAERFPPLQTRILHLDKKDVAARLGGTEEEDAILIRELLQRTLTPDEFDALISAAELPADRRRRRVILTIKGIVESGRTMEYENALRHAFQSFESRGPDEVALSGALIGALIAIPGIDFSSEAAALVQMGISVREALAYLERRGSSRQVLEMLTQLRLSPQHEEQRGQAVEAMRLRIKTQQ